MRILLIIKSADKGAPRENKRKEEEADKSIYIKGLSVLRIA